MRDVRQMGGITLDPEVNDGKRSVLLRARASSHADHTGQNITVEIIDPAKKLPLYRATAVLQQQMPDAPPAPRSVEHTAELQSLMRISYAAFCLTIKHHHLHHIRQHLTHPYVHSL